jgi:proteasome lid subunit RPN8/RPN11
MTTRVQEAISDLDLGSISSQDWPSRKFPVRKRDGNTSPLVIKRSVLNEIAAHGRGSADIEVCGVLIGNIYRDAGKPFIHIEGCIRGNHAAGKSAQVTFTAETWTHIQESLENDHPGKRILGWYHTHPGYGIFLSEMDVFIHKNFFSLPWHTAFVYDPIAHEDGLFSWHEGKLASEKYLVQEDAIATSPDDDRSERRTRPQMPVSPNAQPGTVMELSARLQVMENRQRWLIAGMALCVLVAIAWPLVINLIIPALRNDAPDAVDITSLRAVHADKADGQKLAHGL